MTYDIQILGFWVVILRRLSGGYHEDGGSISIYILTRPHGVTIQKKQNLNHHRGENFKTYIDFTSFCVSRINVYLPEEIGARFISRKYREIYLHLQ